MTEKLVFDLLIGRDEVSAGFARTGKSASGASDDVLGLAKRLDEISKKSVQARVGLAGDKEALAQLDRLDLKLLTTGRKVVDPKITLDGAARASAEISALDVQLDKLGAKSAGTEAAVGAGGLAGPSGMGALIGAGVVLSPILTTLAFGLGGFGLAAAGVALPIEKAASKTGGLQKNMHLLNPEQQAVARGLLGLKQVYGQFEQQLQPEVFGVFNRGLQLAAHLMHDVEPVASATGSAVGTLLGRVDAEFQSGTWQSFFGFMAREAGPDIQLVGNNLVDLMNTLPPLLRDLQPLAKGFLEASDGALKLAGTVVRLSDQERELAKKSTESSGWLGRLAKSAQQAFQQMYPGTKVTGILAKTLDHIGSSGSGPAAKGLNAVTTAAKPAFNAVTDLNSALTHLNDLLSNQSSEISWKQAQIAATKAIDAGSKALDGNSSKHLANRALVVQSTQSLLGLIDNEKKSGVSVHTMAGQLQNQILFLQRAHDKSQFMRAELALLRRALADIKSENIAIHISGSGSWAVVGGGHRVLSGGHPPGTGPVAARGLFISTGTPGVDDQLIRAQKGELVVPVPMVNSGEVDHLRGRIPGFAGGGVVGHYGDGLGGLTKWIRSENSATITAIANSVAAAFKAAKPAPGTGGGHVGWSPGAGVAQWAGDVSSALAQVGLPDSYKLLVLYQMMTESGGNPNIVNTTDSNWLAGHPSVGLMQVIQGTFDAYAGPYRNTGPFSYGVSVDPMANIFAALNYGTHNGRGFGTGPGQIGSGHGYANGGMITEPIVGVGASGTRYSFGERGPEWVSPGRGGGNTYNIHIHTLVADRQTGRVVVDAIVNYERAAGPGWRS